MGRTATEVEHPDIRTAKALERIAAALEVHNEILMALSFVAYDGSPRDERGKLSSRHLRVFADRD